MNESLIGEAFVGLVRALTEKVEQQGETDHERFVRKFDERSRKFDEEFRAKLNR